MRNKHKFLDFLSDKKIHKLLPCPAFFSVEVESSHFTTWDYLITKYSDVVDGCIVKQAGNGLFNIYVKVGDKYLLHYHIYKEGSDEI